MLRLVATIHMRDWGPPDLNQDLLSWPSVVNILRAEYSFCMTIPPSYCSSLHSSEWYVVRTVKIPVCPLHSFFWRFCIVICIKLHDVQVFLIYWLLCLSFRFDPAYPRPDSASSDAGKYLFPVQYIHICTCVGSKTVNPPIPSPNLSLKPNFCEILYIFSYLWQGVNLVKGETLLSSTSTLHLDQSIERNCIRTV